MGRKYTFNTRVGRYIRNAERAGVNYDVYATKEWALLLSFFRWYPDVMEDILEGKDKEYSNSLMGRVTKRYMARYERTFTYGSRGYGKTSCVISDRCNKGILWPGTITGYYAPASKQAAPIASKAFAGYKRNVPILAAHWEVNHNTTTSFQITTQNGSKFLMDLDRGIDTSSVVAEECGQEDKNPFNWEDFNQIVLPTNRKGYTVNGADDQSHVNFQAHYITSASRKENEAYRVCEKIRRDMMAGESAYALWIPWEVVVLCRMKPYSYYRNLRRELTAEQFERECESKCTGSIESPIVKDSDLQASRKIKVMEDQHCGDPECFYVIGYDVSSRDVAGNALCGQSVLKCERQYDTAKWDHYRKSVVYCADTRPPKSAREHAAIIKQRWKNYSMADGQSTFIVIDARAYGQAVVECLHEDLNDGLPPMATITHEEPYVALEQPGAIPCIYPLQATGNAGRDPNTVMLDYIEREFENGNLRLLTPNLVDGTNAYKLKNGIKDDQENIRIQAPYLSTNKLCQQIGNLQKKHTTNGWVEQEISKAINKDIWSATLYACRFAQRMEHDVLYGLNHNVSEWEEEAKKASAVSVVLAEPIRRRAVKRLGRGAIRR